MSVAFTSPMACDQIAKRTVRSLSGTAEHAAKLVGKFIEPTASQILGRGKCREGSLKALCRTLLARLQDDEAIINPSVMTMVAPPSAKEAYHVSFVIAVGDRKEDWIEFLGCEVSLTRKTLSYTLTPMDIHLHHHVLSRFMQRERKPVKEFFKGFVQPLDMAHTIAAALAYTNHGQIVLPFGDGLLCGEVCYIDPSTDASGIMVELRQREEPCFTLVDRPSLLSSLRTKIVLRTFVSAAALNVNRQRLRAHLRAFEAEHALGCRNIFDRLVNSNLLIPVSEIEALVDSQQKAVDAARTLVLHRDWEHFGEFAGRGITLAPSAYQT